MIHKDRFKIRTSECDKNMKLMPAVVLDLFQEVAARHCEKFNLDSPELIRKHNYGWILSSLAIDFKKHPSWPEKVDVETWAKNLTGFKASRDYAISDIQGENIINGTSIWALLDLEKRRPVKIDTIASEMKVNSGVDAVSRKPGRVRLPEDLNYNESDIKVNVGNIDMNGHACNIEYISWLYQNTDKEYLKLNELESLNISYIDEAYLGDDLIYKSSIVDNEGAHIFVNKESGKEICKISSTWRKIG